MAPGAAAGAAEPGSSPVVAVDCVRHDLAVPEAMGVAADVPERRAPAEPEVEEASRSSAFHLRCASTHVA